jgi:hypothetical protein
MTPRALTPLFRCLGRWSNPRPPENVSAYPAASPGNDPAEARFLALGTLFLTATWAIPATAAIASLWLRLPLIGLLLFIVPHLIMGLVALLSPWLASPRLSRESAQDWACLAVMTAWAAYRSAGGGWEAHICQGWLVFAALNLLFIPFQPRPQ